MTRRCHTYFYSVTLLFCFPDIILKVRPLVDTEIQHVRDEGALISFLYPAQNQDLIKKLAAKKVDAFGKFLHIHTKNSNSLRRFSVEKYPTSKLTNHFKLQYSS